MLKLLSEFFGRLSLQRQIAQLQVQLASCSSAAAGGLLSIKPGDYGWSSACQDVIDLRRRNELLLDAAARSVASATFRAENGIFYVRVAEPGIEVLLYGDVVWRSEDSVQDSTPVEIGRSRDRS